jgi:hypothetical protein
MNQNKYGIGTIGIASRDIEAFPGKIQKGDRVQIVGIDDVQPSRGYDLLDLETGVKLIETGFDSIIPARNGEIKFDIGTIGIASRDIVSSLLRVRIALLFSVSIAIEGFSGAPSLTYNKSIVSSSSFIRKSYVSNVSSVILVSFYLFMW